MWYSIASIFALTLLLSYGFERKQRAKQIYYFIGFLLVVFATAADKSSLPDYAVYVSYLKADFVVIEPTFLIIKNFVNSCLGGREIFLFCIYAILGIGLKLIAFRELTSLPILSLAVYISSYFIYHELIQIRAGVAAALFLLAIKPLYERNIRRFLVISVIAVSFHASAVCILPLWFINTTHRQSAMYLLLIPFSMLLYLLDIDLINLLKNIPVPYLQDKIINYSNISSESIGRGLLTAKDYNPFMTWNLFKAAIAFFFWAVIGRIRQHNKYALLLLKIYTIGISCLWLLSGIPTVAFRISELLTIVQVILVPLSVYAFKNKSVSYFPALAVSCLWLAWNLNSFFN